MTLDPKNMVFRTVRPSLASVNRPQPHPGGDRWMVYGAQQNADSALQTMQHMLILHDHGESIIKTLLIG